MKHYMYKTTNLVNKKIYIGVRSVRISNIEDDLYLGSGIALKSAIKKYGIENFKKEILQIFKSSNEAFNAERITVNQDFVDREDTYNIAIGGKGGKLWDIVPWNKGKRFSEESRARISNSLKGKMSGEKNPMFGVDVASIMTPEANTERLKKISEKNRGKKRSENQKKNYSSYASKRKWIVNKHGETSHLRENDSRLETGEWQLGTKWKN